MENALASALKNSGFIGYLVLLLLFVLSVFVWATFISRWRAIRKMETDTAWFLDQFIQNRKDLFELANTLDPTRRTPLSRILVGACKDLKYYFVREGRTKIPAYVLDDVYNGMNRTLAEIDLEQREGLTLLASATTVSPLLGLFGTVWGIMESFRDMWIHGSANITVVAPGISDALLTTVAGLMVAIPAAAVYNILLNRINRNQTKAENFCSELLCVIERIYVER